MQSLWRIFIASLLCGVLSVSASYAKPVPEGFAEVVAPVMPAVVNISTTQKIKTPPMAMFPGLDPSDPQLAPFQEFFRQFGAPLQMAPRERKVSSLGSGFVIDPAGYIVTNNHVVGEATEITVTFHDDTKLPAKIVGKDPRTDLALLKVKSGKPLAAVKFGNSDATRVGDWVVAVGNPFGLGGSVSAGIVSARGRNINAGAYDDFIQTDAAINRGNSGGPLFNMAGEVIGVNSAIYSPNGGNIGIGFAVPASLAQPVISQLQKSGHITRGWLGVKIQPVTDEVADSLGLPQQGAALVAEVTPAGPAAKAGLIGGDVILSFDGKPITAQQTLPRLVAEAAVGKRVPITLLRRGERKTITVQLGELPEEEAAEARDPAYPQQRGERMSGEKLLGLYLKPLTPALAQQFGIARSGNGGLLVTGLDPEGVALEKGLRPGDILEEVNQRPLASVAALREALANAKKQGREFLLLGVRRGEDSVFVTLPVK